MKSKLTKSQHIDICKPINLLNEKWGDKNPPQATQLWLKPRSRSDLVDDEGEKEELLGKIPRYTYLTLTPPYNLIG